MLLTPPDVISQTLLAVPMWILFELGLIFSRWYTKDKTAAKVSDKESAEGKTEENAGADAGMAAAVAGNGERIEPSFSDTHESSEEVDDSTEDNAYGDLNGEDDDSNESGHQEFEPLTEEEMDAELDRIEAEEALEDDNEEQDESESVPDSEPKPPKDDKAE